MSDGWNAEDQVERFRFALQMCKLHAQQPDPVDACAIIIQQVEAAFRIEQKIKSGELR